MKLWDMLRTANRNLFRNKLRTFLTVIAIFVGSFTLTLTNGLGDGLRTYVENQVKNIDGANVVFVEKKIEAPADEASADGPAEYKEQKADDGSTALDPNSFTITVPQMEAALKDAGGIKSITPAYQVHGEYISLDGEKKYSAEIAMLSEGMTQKTEAGKTISGAEQIVIPLGLARTLDPNIESLIGKTATVAYKDADKALKTLKLQIVGVATKGFMANTNSFVDSQTAHLIYSDQQRGQEEAGKFFRFTIQMASADEKAIGELKQKLNEKGFEGTTMADRRKRTYDAIGIFKIGMSLVALIALLAASFGIINTLVIAVLERTREIGLQKALGMSRGRVFLIFSFESILIGFWGALLGILGGMLVGTIASQYLMRAYAASFEGYTLFVFTLPSIAIVMTLVCLIAFFAGVLPAFRASRLNPIEALRYE
jgi:putative ABC transport system permease protein